ncbi:DUF6303 family protein [Streptomyces sp. NPDC020800]|uniref:DUF6303 family protein n=1 Tax=Streptomyces sp. NPDC020800 TaxID=3365092 RepID=UPI00378DB6C7
MAREYRAQLLSGSPGRWMLYVALRHAPAPWPAHSFRQTELPTFTQRAQALNLLGFEPVPGAVWEWAEYNTDPADPSSPVWLLACVRVRSREGADA